VVKVNYGALVQGKASIETARLHKCYSKAHGIIIPEEDAAIPPSVSAAAVPESAVEALSNTLQQQYSVWVEAEERKLRERIE
jgi:hypothetical protein